MQLVQMVGAEHGARTEAKTSRIGKLSGADWQTRRGVSMEHRIKTRQTAGVTPVCLGCYRWRPGNPPKDLPPNASPAFTAANDLFASTLEGGSCRHVSPQMSEKGIPRTAGPQANSCLQLGTAESRLT